MSRPQQVGLSYFPFNADFLSDPNMLILMDEHSSIGFLVYMCLVSEIFRIEGYYVRLNERYVRILCAKLSISKEKFYSILQCCVEIGIFDAGLWETEKVLTSKYIQKVYQKAKMNNLRHNKIVVNPEIWLLEEENTSKYIQVGGGESMEYENSYCNNPDNYSKNPDSYCNNSQSNASPLIIKVEQKLTVSEKMLIIPRFLSDFETDASVSGENFTLKLQNALKKGDKVLLLRMQGGQKFVILDKLKEDK